jgi:hypothetical protein
MPLDVRRRVARTLLERAGYTVTSKPTDPEFPEIDPGGLVGERR